MSEECTIQRERIVTEERRRVRRQRERCRRGAWWQRLLCHFENYFRWIVREVVSWIEEQVCHIVTAIQEARDALAQWLLTLTTDLHIISSVGRNVPSVPNSNSFSRSFAASINYENVEERLLYTDEGKFLEFKIQPDGKVHWRKQGEADFVLFRPSEFPGIGIIPPRDSNLRGLSVTYENSRKGQWSWIDGLEFDMIASSSDRVFAKERGTDNFFMAIPTELYLHQTNKGSLLKLPQTFFKLDPENNLPHQRVEDLLHHISVPLDDETHLATERFPAVRTIFSVLRSQVSVLSAQIRRMLFGIGPININNEFPLMSVQAPSFVWVGIDTRPIHKTKNPPRRFPSYNHVTYGNDPFSSIPIIGDFLNSLIRIRKRSIRFNRVLSMGVGLSHLHEQYVSIYGGEADSLQSPGPFDGVRINNLLRAYLTLTSLPRSNAELYRFLNGPTEDRGGWVDGTCIYYLMVQLRSDAEIENEVFENAFCVLWADEQFAFTERWRALHYIDSEFDSVSKPIVSAIKSGSSFYSFDYRKFWCPFENGHIRRFSRMTVARQVIIVNGFDANLNEHEIYSIHFCWPTMDHTWRVRRLPMQATVVLLPLDSETFRMEEIAELNATTVFPQTIHLKEDMTLSMRGSMEIGGKFIPGFWVQKYLPATNQEVPSLAQLERQEPFQKPMLRYSHEWEFYPGHSFEILIKNSSHFGVYQKVDSRIQFYTIKINAFGLSADFVEQNIWEDTEHAFTIHRREFDWSTVQLSGFVRDVVTRDIASTHMDYIDHPSLFEDVLRFRIRRRGQLGFILMFEDKRDDKIIAFDKIDNFVTLQQKGNPGRTIDVKIISHLRSDTDSRALPRISSPEVSFVEVVLHLNSDDTPNFFAIRLISARSLSDYLFPALFEEWIMTNLFKIKLGFPEDGNSIVFDLDIHESLERAFGTNEFVGDVGILATTPFYSALRSRIEETSRRNDVASVWFEGVTGLVNIAEVTRFRVA